MPPSPFAVLHASGHKPPCLRPYRSLDQRLGIVAVPSGGAVHGGDQAAPLPSIKSVTGRPSFFRLLKTSPRLRRPPRRASGCVR